MCIGLHVWKYVIISVSQACICACLNGYVSPSFMLAVVCPGAKCVCVCGWVVAGCGFIETSNMFFLDLQLRDRKFYII